jgi:hypothetical protein
MADGTQTPIEVTSAQGVTDALQALIRYLVVIAGFITGLGTVLGTHDAAAAVAYVQTNLGPVVAAVFSLVGLLTAAWGIYKTFKRGSQLATVAASSQVPNSVARLTK